MEYIDGRPLTSRSRGTTISFSLSGDIFEWQHFRMATLGPERGTCSGKKHQKTPKKHQTTPKHHPKSNSKTIKKHLKTINKHLKNSNKNMKLDTLAAGSSSRQENLRKPCRKSYTPGKLQENPQETQKNLTTPKRTWISTSPTKSLENLRNKKKHEKPI